MKTVIDAVNEFKGEWYGSEDKVYICDTGVITDYDQFNDLASQMETNFGECIPYAEYKTEYARKEKVIIMLDELHKLIDEPVKELDVLINCTSNNDQQPAQVFTQAMADNADFLPPVNMIVKHKGVKKIVIGELDYNNNLALKSIDNELYSLGHIYDIKPLTPPIELIDGKAYQFDVRDKCGIVNGIYNDYDKKLHVGQDHYFDLISATNIQPLTVEVK